MAALGLIASWWAVLCLPAAMLVSFAFGGIGMFATCYNGRSWQDFDLNLACDRAAVLVLRRVLPALVVPGWLRTVVMVTPLYKASPSYAASTRE